MATQSVSAADAILKEDYPLTVQEALNNKTWLRDKIDRDVDSVDHTGRRAIFPIHTGRNRGRGSIADAGTLPTAGRQSWQDAIVSIRYHYLGIEISDGLIEAANTNTGAFVNALNAEMEGATRDFRKDINRQAYGDGTGLLATPTSNAAGVITLNESGDQVKAQYIEVGDVVDILVQSSGATTNGVVGATVTAVSRGATSQTVTVSPAPAGAVGNTYGIYVAGNRNNEMDGLRNIAKASRTLHSINSATAGNEFWNASTITVSGVAGESSFEQLADATGGVSNTELDVFLATRGIRRRLADTYQSQKRFNDANATKIHGGYSAIMVSAGNGEVPVVADDDAPKGFAFGINNSALRWFQQTAWGWLQRGDGGIFHLKDGTTAGTKVSVWQAWGREYSALGSVSPNRIGALLACTDDQRTA